MCWSFCLHLKQNHLLYSIKKAYWGLFTYRIFYIKVNRTAESTNSSEMWTYVVENSVFEPRVSRDWGFTPITVIIKQLFLCFDVSGRHQDQMRGSIDGVKLSLAVSSFTMVDQSSKACCFRCSVHTVRWTQIKIKLSLKHKTGINTRSHSPEKKLRKVCIFKSTARSFYGTLFS